MKEKILELRLQNKTINKIANELNCAKSTVSYHLNSLGLGGEILRITDNISDFYDVLLMKKSGLTNQQIFNKSPLSKDKIIKIVKINNLNDPNKIRRPTEKDIKIMQDLYDKYKSTYKVAERCKWSRYTICKYVKIKKIRNYTQSERKEVRKKAVIDWRVRTKKKLVEYKGGCCERCGYDKTIQALQFHHLNPDEKDFSISGKSYSYERMKKEVDKCMMVCANCHIEIHEEERKNRMP